MKIKTMAFMRISKDNGLMAGALVQEEFGFACQGLRRVCGTIAEIAGS